MTTMPHKHVSANIVYVDPGATGTNTGASPANAKTALPSVASMAASTVYLIRRGTTVNWTVGTSSSKHALGIMGMPKSTDPLYDAMPAEAKTAWNADAADYAVIHVPFTGTTTTIFQTANGLSLFRLDFQSTQSVAQPTVPFMQFTSVNMLSIEKCKSRILAIDMTSISSYNTANDKILPSWVVRTCIGVYVKSCWFEKNWDYSAYGITGSQANGRAFCLDIAQCGDIYVEDCDFYYALPGYGSSMESNSAACRISTVNTYEYAIVRSLRFHIVEMRDPAYAYAIYAGGWAPALLMQTSRAGILDSITVTARMIGSQTYSGSGAWGGCGDDSGAGAFYCVKYSDFPSNDNYAQYAVDASNISIDLTGLSQAFGGMLFCSGFSSSRNVTNEGRFTLTNYTFLAPQSAYGGSDMTMTTMPPGPVGLGVGDVLDCELNNITVNYPNVDVVACDFGLAGHNNLQTTGFNTPYYSSGIHVNNLNVIGHIIALQGYVDLRTCAIIAGATLTAVHAMSSAQVYIGTLTLGSDWPTTTPPVYSRDNSQIMVNASNMPGNWAAAGFAAAAEVNNHVAVANADGAAGAWKSYTQFASVVTTVVYRTGGAAAALFMKTPTAPSRLYGPWLSPFPYAAKSIDPGGTGRRILHAYIAMKGFTTNYRKIFASIQIQIDAPAGVYPNTRPYLSTTDGWMEADGASAWNNDAGLVAFRICIPFNVDRYENIGVRVHFAPFFESISTYFYFDPKLEVVAG